MRKQRILMRLGALLLAATAALPALAGGDDASPAAAAGRVEGEVRTELGHEAGSEAESEAGSEVGNATARPDTAPRAGWRPSPFEADYLVRYDGVPFTVTGTRSLARGTDGALLFESSISSWILKVRESASIRLDADGTLQPVSYAYRQSGLGRKRTRLLDFDWATGTLHRGGDREKTVALEGPVFDPVSWQIALQSDLALGRGPVGTILEYPITDGGDVKLYSIAVRGRERLELPGGAEETVLVERLFEPDDQRTTRIWLAPERDWLMVRLESTDDDGRTLSLSLKPPTT
ncbi:MAG TPA: DUF3108 domain-containing protein [Pseudomonadales bacterium]|nr:DUF3108 domain-containing protein [Pseudomonadales bacterium]